MADILADTTGSFGKIGGPFATDSANRPKPRGGKSGDDTGVDAKGGGGPGGGTIIGGCWADAPIPMGHGT